MIYSAFIIAFAVSALLKTYSQYKKSHISFHWFTLWSFIWLLAIIVAIVPDSTSYVANFVGIGRGADLLIYSAILILLYGFYRLIIGQERQRNELTKLVRELAIKNAKKPE